MERREFLLSTASIVAGLPFVAEAAVAQAVATPPITRWHVRTAEGMDAVAFLGALSGGALYLEHYAREADEFGRRLPKSVLSDLRNLSAEADKADFGLLWPGLATIFSGADFSRLPQIVSAVSQPETALKPTFSGGAYWSKSDWAWFIAAAPRLRVVFQAMLDAGFPQFRTSLLGASLDGRAAQLQEELQQFDIIRLQRKLTGNLYDPDIGIVLLYFSKPHGVRVQHQTFLQSADYDLTITLRIAGHEILHPPIDMHGAVAKRVLARLERDPLFNRIVKQHDPKWGYTTADGLLNEDICQALDQIVAEHFGVAHNPADRWRQSDDGMHVLAAGLYGMLRSDGWERTGGSITQWLDRAERSGRLAPVPLHAIAARVLERPVDRLWPLPPSAKA